MMFMRNICLGKGGCSISWSVGWLVCLNNMIRMMVSAVAITKHTGTPAAQLAL